MSDAQTNYDFDLIVIGSGPAGEMAAVEASFLGKSVALIEKEKVLGGAAVNTGTIPSKTLRETALFLAGSRQRALFGLNVSIKAEAPTACEFLFHERKVVEREREKFRARLEKHQVKIYAGVAAFQDAHTISIDGGNTVTAETMLVATGSRPFRPPIFPADDKRIFDSNTILEIGVLPRSLIVVGAGVIGCEYACIFASLGVKVTLIHGQEKVLSFLDSEVQSLLEQAMKAAGIRICKSDRVQSAAVQSDGVAVHLESDSTITADALLIAAGRSSNTDDLCLNTAGVDLGERGLIKVNAHYQTNISNIYAAGDVIGFPALASTSIAQARIAVEHAFRPAEEELPSVVLPYGIYTIPECAMVGETEEQLSARGADFVVGKGEYSENARGLIIGEEFGLLKLLFDRSSRTLLGVHIIGEQATELIHTGIIAMSTGATADVFMRTCFNYPTLSELYKHAAYAAFGKPAIE
jgi:NAD(P) transhydrogenase